MTRRRFKPACSVCTRFLLLALLGHPSAAASPRNVCQTLNGLSVGRSSIHDVVRQLAAPSRVYLSSQDSEAGEPGKMDDLVLAYENKSVFGVPGHASLFFFIPPGSSTIASIIANFGNPYHSSFVGLTVGDVQNAFGDPGFRFRRTLDLGEDSGEDAVAAECEDPDGALESWVYPDRCIEVQFFLMKPERRGFLIRVGPEIAQQTRPPICKRTSP